MVIPAAVAESAHDFFRIHESNRDTVERLLKFLGVHELAILFAMLESHVPDKVGYQDDLPPEIDEQERLLRRIEMWAHSEGFYDFSKDYLPAARRVVGRCETCPGRVHALPDADKPVRGQK